MERKLPPARCLAERIAFGSLLQWMRSHELSVSDEYARESKTLGEADRQTRATYIFSLNFIFSMISSFRILSASRESGEGGGMCVLFPIKHDRGLPLITGSM